jgi:hypothetical protein
MSKNIGVAHVKKWLLGIVEHVGESVSLKVRYEWY